MMESVIITANGILIPFFFPVPNTSPSQRLRSYAVITGAFIFFTGLSCFSRLCTLP